LSSETKKTVYFLTGHNEVVLEDVELEGMSDAKTALENDNYEVKSLLLMREAKVPEDCTVLVLAGANTQLYQEELLAITEYLNRGGAALFLVDTDAPQQLLDYLEGFGFTVGHNMVVDRLTQLFGGDYFMPLAVKFEPHAITENFKLNPLFPLVRSVLRNTEAGDRVKTQQLFYSSEESWAETDLQTIKEGGEIQFDKDADLLGPVSLAAVAEIAMPTTQPDEPDIQSEEPEAQRKAARIVTVGDADFTRNRYFNYPGNNDLFLNIVSWLAEEESLIAIRPKKTEAQPVMLTDLQNKFLFLIPILFLPGVVAANGLIALSQRRRYR